MTALEARTEAMFFRRLETFVAKPLVAPPIPRPPLARAAPATVALRGRSLLVVQLLRDRGVSLRLGGSGSWLGR
ncbi:MAG: hypothetical protein DRJ56_03610 [Thermoprotei archaeon]|nr:MAG: hypothetical protein DRJ56_03610 [Thermoprotei archaeon]